MIELRRYGVGELGAVRQVLLGVYAEVWADEVASDPFMSVARFDERLSGHAGMVAWEAVVGWDGGEPVGYAYGSGVRVGGDRRWHSVTPRPPEDFAREPGGRTFVLFELMVRQPWRKTGVSRQLHDALLAERPESRVTLTVDPDHPRVVALYESWGYTRVGRKKPFPDSPTFVVMVLGLR